MSRASCLALALAALLAVTPAAAQTYDEMVGTYRMKVEPERGSICEPGETGFQILGIDGRTVHYVLDGTRATGRWDADNKSFDGVIPFPDESHLIQVYGAFSRGPDRVNLVVNVTFPPDRPCRATLSGSRSASNLMDPPQPPSGPPPSPTAPPVFGVAPQPGTPPVMDMSPHPGPPPSTDAYNPGQPPAEIFLNRRILGVDIKILIGAAVVVLLILAGMSLRKKPAPPVDPKD